MYLNFIYYYTRETIGEFLKKTPVFDFRILVRVEPWFDFQATVNLRKRRWPPCKIFFLCFQKQPREI